MISKIAGIISKKDTKTKQWWLKLGIALILSNIFFFLLFSGNEVQSPEQEPSLPAGWVEIQLKAELMTPFHEGKKILIINRPGRLKLEGELKGQEETEGRITILVKESEAQNLFLHEEWEILPFISNMKFGQLAQGPHHEIKY